MGADVNFKNEYGDTALKWAIKYDYTLIINLLKKHGAK
jgi:ankyrin repeat protein